MFLLFLFIMAAGKKGGVVLFKGVYFVFIPLQWDNVPPSFFMPLFRA